MIVFFPLIFLQSSLLFVPRKANSNNEVVVLRSPATPERIRMACMDELVLTNIVEPKEDEKGWVIGV